MEAWDGASNPAEPSDLDFAETFPEVAQVVESRGRFGQRQGRAEAVQERLYEYVVRFPALEEYDLEVALGGKHSRAAEGEEQGKE